MATRTQTLSELGNDRAYFKFKFIVQQGVPMVSHGRPSYSSAARPAFEEVPRQDIIQCRAELDNLSKTQSGKLAYIHNRYGTWMHPSATIRLGTGGSQLMSNFVFKELFVGHTYWELWNSSVIASRIFQYLYSGHTLASSDEQPPSASAVLPALN